MSMTSSADDDPTTLLPLLTHSLILHFTLFLLCYSTAYWLFYCDFFFPGVENRFKKLVAPYKCVRGVYPPPDLVRKEIIRSSTATLILVGWDVFIQLCLFRGDVFSSTAVVPVFATEADATITDWAKFISLTIIWSDFHFYAYHRLNHEVKWLYLNIHKVHHESVNPNPWSGLSFHPLESWMYFSSLLGLLILPKPSRAMYCVFRLGLLLAPIGGHVGYSTAVVPVELDPTVVGRKSGGSGTNKADDQQKLSSEAEQQVDDHDLTAHKQQRLQNLVAASWANHFLHHEKFNYNYGSGLLGSFSFDFDAMLGTRYRGNGS